MPAPRGSFKVWLRHLPLKPAGVRVRDYRGNIQAWPKGRVAAVVDLDLIGRVQDCAASAFRLWAEYLVARGRGRRLLVEMNQKQRLSWRDYLRGCRPGYYPASKKLAVKCGYRALSVKRPGRRRKALKDYVRRVMTWTNSWTFSRTLGRVAKADIAPGTLLVQPNRTGGTGHLSLVVDGVSNRAGKRRFLVAMGFMPAQNMMVVSPPATPRRFKPWCTMKAFAKFMSSFGPLRYHRFR